MIAVRGYWVAMSVVVAGCSLANDPDRNRLLVDAGVSRSELLCSNGVDDDNDALTDCADLDCAQQPECCDDQTSIIEVASWSADLFGDADATFAVLPTADPQLPTLETQSDATVIAGFAANDVPRAVLANECVPSALGSTVRAQLTPRGDPNCTAIAPCDRYGALVVTTAADMAPGNRLLDELAIRVYAGGHIEATQSNVVVATDNVVVNEDLEVTIRLVTRVEDDIPTLFARVTIDTSDGSNVLLNDFAVLPLADLVREDACAKIAGVRIATEAVGTRVAVGAVEAAIQSCVSPSQFTEPNATLMSETMEFDPSWTVGAIGRPSLATSRASPTSVRWDVLVEGTNDNPDLLGAPFIGYAIGQAQAIHPDGGDWDTTPGVGWLSSGAPKSGDDPPSCAMVGGCDANRSVRDPFLYAVQRADGTPDEFILAAAREVVGADNVRNRFALHVEGGAGGPTDRPFGLGTARLSPDDFPDCVSLRDPSLIPVDPGGNAGYWLLFTCEREGGAASEIQAVRLRPTLAVIRDGGVVERHTLIDSAALGDFAARGVFGAEPLVQFDEGAALVRVWFLATALNQEISVGLAEGQFLDADLLADDLPPMTPFPVNPVIRNTDFVTPTCPMPSLCRITGISVARRIDLPNRLRFLLARHVNNSVPGDDELIALEQQVR